MLQIRGILRLKNRPALQSSRNALHFYIPAFIQTKRIETSRTSDFFYSLAHSSFAVLPGLWRRSWATFVTVIRGYRKPRMRISIYKPTRFIILSPFVFRSRAEADLRSMVCAWTISRSTNKLMDRSWSFNHLLTLEGIWARPSSSLPSLVLTVTWHVTLHSRYSPRYYNCSCFQDHGSRLVLDLHGQLEQLIIGSICTCN